MNFSSLWWSFALIVGGSYLFGSMNNAIIISRLLGKDIRKLGSGNPGTMNVSRTLGMKIGGLVLFLDALKGALPVLIAKLVFGSACFEDSTLPVGMMAQYMAGFFVVLGHIFPVYYKFKGGKGIASTIGVFLVCNTWVALIFGIVALLFIFVTRVGSMGSFLATTPPAIFSCISLYNNYFVSEPNLSYGLTYFIISNMFILGIVALTWFAHRQNIGRLLSGDEHPTDWWRMIKDSKINKEMKEAHKEAEKAETAETER